MIDAARIALLTATALVAAMIGNSAEAQEFGQLEGRVTLAITGEPLHGARVLMIELGRSTLTDEDGRFRFDGVPPGDYEILAVREHLQAARAAVAVVPGQTTTMDFALSLSAVHEEVTVTATGRDTTAFDAFNTVDVLDSVELAQNMASSLGEVLAGQPNVAKRSFGPGSSRPIIRGFDGDRVLIMQDGVNTGDLSSQSGDHGTTIDPGSLEKIEILKGPATLLYGSSAIGGVVNTISPQQQFYDNPPSELRGQVTADLGTANEQAGGNGNFQYGNGRFMLWFGGGGRRSSDYGTPQGTVENSFAESANARVGAGWFAHQGWLSASYQLEDGTYGVPVIDELQGNGGAAPAQSLDEPGDLRIELETRRHALRVDGGLRQLDGFVETVQATFSYLDYRHDEIENFASSGERELGTSFNNDSSILRIEAHQRATGKLGGQFGIWGKRRDYRAIGEEALAPPTRQTAFAGFVYEELDLGGASLQFGARYEHNEYQPDDRSEPAGRDEAGEAPDVRDRSFSGLSGSIGVRIPVTGSRAAIVASVSSAYRAPALEELYNFGPHVGNLAFEIGNPELVHERSNGGEVSFRYNAASVHGNFNVFYYKLDDFIFGAPTGEVRGGLLELSFAQQSARYAGFDTAWQFHIDSRLQIHIGGGLVSARLTDTDQWVPRIPPASGKLSLEWNPIPRLQVRPGVTVASSQKNVFATETPTDGYTTLALLGSYTIVGAKTMHVITLNLTNATDRLFRNHSSLIKDFAPEMGRRLLLTYALRLF